MFIESDETIPFERSLPKRVLIYSTSERHKFTKLFTSISNNVQVKATFVRPKLLNFISRGTNKKIPRAFTYLFSMEMLNVALSRRFDHHERTQHSLVRITIRAR